MLLSDVRFWTCTSPEFALKEPTDLAIFTYSGDKQGKRDVLSEGKVSYAMARGTKSIVDNKKPHRLRRNWKKLDAELKAHNVVYAQWISSNIVQIMLSNGLLAYISLNPLTSDVFHVSFDKFFVGKLVSAAVNNVIFSKLHILISYNENQVTFVYLQKPNLRRNNPEKIQNMDPKIFNFVIGGPIRKTPRQMSCNTSCDLLAVWTKGSQMEVYPWRPTGKDQERANLHIYKLSRMKLELLTYYWTEHDPLCVEFSKQAENQLHSIEQKVSRKGIVTVESCMYQIHKTKLNRLAVTSIPLQTQVCCCKFSPDHEKIVLGCIDGSIILLDTGRAITHLVKAAFIPTLISWHSDAAILMIGNDRCQLQCFDISLSCVKNQLLSEDVTQSAVLDLSSCFNTQTNLFKMIFSKKPDTVTHYERYAQEDSHLLLCFENGLLGCLRIVGGAGLKNDIHKTGITADVLVHYYIEMDQIEKAINVLLSLNWDAYGAMCLVSLHKIANYIFRKPLTCERELQLQKALGSFHVPVKPLCEETTQEFGDQVDDITRRFFHYLLRFESFEKAFSLAIDINDADLFMDLFRVAKSQGLLEIAEDASKKAEEIYKQIEIEDDTSHSTCSNSSCSLCFSGSETESEEEDEDEEETENEQTHTPPPTSHGTPHQQNSNELISNGQPKLFKSNSAEILNRPAISKTKMLPRTAVPHKQYIPPLPFVARSTTAQKVCIKPDTKSITTAASMSNLRAQNPLYENRIIDTQSSKDFLSLDSLSIKTGLTSDSSPLKPPKPSPRRASKDTTDCVLSVLPTPGSAFKTRFNDNIDQTLGIPLSPPSANQTNFARRWPPITGPGSGSGGGSEFVNPVANYRPVFHNHPLIAGNIPSMIPTPSLLTKNSDAKTSAPNSILSTNSTNAGGGRKESGEKNKVKFSDTVQIAVVPELPRKEKNNVEKIKKYTAPAPNPEKELAESLPLCHPDAYLKDFENQEKEKEKKASTVKVVHFGLV